MNRVLRGKFVTLKHFIMKILNIFEYEILSNLNGYKIRKLHRPSLMFVKEKLGKDLVVAEVGVWKGENAEDMLKYLPIKKIYLIDPWDLDVEEGAKNIENLTDNINEEEMRQAERETIKRMSKFKDKVVIIRKSSTEALKDIKDKLDFVYMDIFGARKDKGIRKEIENYYKKLKKGGIIAGDDIDNGKSGSLGNGVPNAVSRFATENNLDLFINKRDWWCIKK
ncbi:MAG: class I SAM-dependent methyltransferase [Nanoarchaeota archaeon]|nr:class I SAM-dependent methyltransferase [Nanoarchaeota archaeon]